MGLLGGWEADIAGFFLLFWSFVFTLNFVTQVILDQWC